MARFRQPGPAAMAFMNTLAATEARFSVRARSARRPCRARAMPRQAKTRAAASGMAASRAALAGRWRAVSAIRYWAVKLTAAAAAASTHSPALRVVVGGAGPADPWKPATYCQSANFRVDGRLKRAGASLCPYGGHHGLCAGHLETLSCRTWAPMCARDVTSRAARQGSNHARAER